MQQQIEVAKRERNVIAAQRLPDLTFGYFNQTLIGNPTNESGKIASASDRFSGFNVGLSFSIFNRSGKSKIKAAEVNTQIAEMEYLSNKDVVNKQINQGLENYQQNKANVDYYKISALQNADLMLKQAKSGYRQGDIRFTEYLLVAKTALEIKENYLKSILQLNQSIIQLEFLTGAQ